MRDVFEQFCLLIAIKMIIHKRTRFPMVSLSTYLFARLMHDSRGCRKRLTSPRDLHASNMAQEETYLLIKALNFHDAILNR